VREEYRSWHGPSPAFGTLSPLAAGRGAINLAQRKILRFLLPHKRASDLARRKILWSFSLTSGRVISRGARFYGLLPAQAGRVISRGARFYGPSPSQAGRVISRGARFYGLLPAHGEKVPQADEGPRHVRKSRMNTGSFIET